MLAPGGSLVLGQSSDNDKAQSFSGEISQVGIWDKILPAEEIKSLATCSSNEQVLSEHVIQVYCYFK